MRSFSWTILLFCSAAWTAQPKPLDAQELFERYRQVSGGSAWDQAGSIAAHGSISVGGLSGSLDMLEDPASGRSRSSFDLGVVRGAQGFDGTQSWSLDPSGEVRTVDAIEARQQAATQAWLTRRAWWYPQRQSASYGPTRVVVDAGHTFDVLDVTPDGGLPLTLWFDRQNQLLTRTVLLDGARQTTTRWSDWRQVGELKLPHASSQDDGEPRNRIELKFERIELRPAADMAEFGAPRATAGARIADASGQTRIKFELRNNHIYADARINDQPVRMLVDTGGVNLLTPAAAKRLGLKTEGKLAARGVGEQQADVSFAKAKSLQFGAAQLDQPILYMIDLNILEQIEGEALDGVLGYEVFHHFGVEIDYAGGLLTLSKAATFKPATGSSAVPFELADRIPIISAELDGLPMRLTVDTGSRANLTVHSPFAREYQLAEKYQANPESITGWGVGGPAHGRLARLGVLTIGGHPLRNLVADLHTGTQGALADASTSANLGGGVLRQFTVAFDYRARQMYLKPNADFGVDDGADRSGLWLRSDGDALRVLEVAPDSAAAKAGLRRDQRVLKINDRDITKQHLSQWRELLRGPAGSEVRVLIEGEQQPRVLQLEERLPARSVVLSGIE